MPSTLLHNQVKNSLDRFIIRIVIKGFKIMTKEEKIKLIEKSIEKIRPYINADGGDVEFIKLDDDNIVYVNVKGACVGCVALSDTLKDGVGSLIMDEVPEIKDVQLADEKMLMEFYKKKLEEEEEKLKGQ